jgi:hypothetical protein
MSHRLAFFLFSIAVLIGCAASNRLQQAAGSGDEIVVAEGVVPYKADDVPGTKAAALAAAQRSAVEKVVGVYVDAHTRVEKAVAIEQSILTKSSGYVRKYDILNEGRQGDWYHTQIRALVSTKIIHQDLDTLGLLQQPGVGNPRIALVIKESSTDGLETPDAAVRALSQALIQKGFQVVSLPNASTSADPTDLARNTAPGQAELVFTGTARAENMGYTSQELGGMSSYRAIVNGLVLESGTGNVLATVSQAAGGLDATPTNAASKALDNAAAAAAQQLSGLPQQLSERAHVQLTLNGVASFDALAQFEKVLTRVPGVKDHYLRSYSQGTGIAVIDALTDKPSPQELAQNILTYAAPGWTIGQVVGRSVQMSAPPAGK